MSYTSTLRLSIDGEPVAMMVPEKRFYPIQDQITSEVSIRSSMAEDLYIVLAELDDTLDVATFKVYINPLINWVWIGTGLLAFGTMILFLPDRLGKKKSVRGSRPSRRDPRVDEPETESVEV